MIELHHRSTCTTLRYPFDPDGLGFLMPTSLHRSAQSIARVNRNHGRWEMFGRPPRPPKNGGRGFKQFIKGISKSQRKSDNRNAQRCLALQVQAQVRGD